MSSIRRILCPVDFSEPSTHAVDHATALAQFFGARITVLHVVPTVGRPPTLPVPDGGGSHAPDDADLELLKDRAASMVPADAGVRVEVSLTAGPIVPAIAEAARATATDLIVIGTHGASGFQHLVLGSVTEKLLRQAPCPVLTVPPRAQATSTLPFRRVLCAVDFSACSEKAGALAGALSRESGATLTLLHVLEWPWHEPPVASVEGVPPEQARALLEYRGYLESGARDRLEHLQSTFGSAPATDIQVRFGKPYVELLDTARAIRADLIVLGAQGRNALDIGLFGSTTNQVVRRATCPVLTISA